MGLEFATAPSNGSSAPGTGTVTSVGTSSSSLRNTSAPNPITTVGNINFELQVIPIDRADLITAVSSGNLLPAVTYSVNDPQAPLNQMFVQALASNRLGNMWGGIGSNVVEVGWSWQEDQITMLYSQRRNNRTSRRAGSPNNCIENFLVTFGTHTNCNLVDCNFVGDGTEQMDNVNIGADADVRVINVGGMDTVNIEGGCTVFVDATPMFCCNVGHRCNLSLSDPTFLGSAYDSCDFMVDAVLVFTEPFIRREYRPYLNEMVNFTASTAGTSSIPDTSKTIISVLLENVAGALMATHTVAFPPTPLDGQLFFISSTNGVTALTLDPGVFTMNANVPALAVGQLVGFYFNAASGEFVQM